MDALRNQVVTLTEEVTTLKAELVNVKAAHANLHQQSSEANSATARTFAEQRSRVEALEAHGAGKGDKKPLMKPEQVAVSEFQGSMTDSRTKFLEWSEKVKDRVELFEDTLVLAMAEAEKRDGEVTAEASAELGVSPFASRQLHGFLKDKPQGRQQQLYGATMGVWDWNHGAGFVCSSTRKHFGAHSNPNTSNNTQGRPRNYQSFQGAWRSGRKTSAAALPKAGRRLMTPLSA